jgi:hypothetical protein
MATNKKEENPSATGRAERVKLTAEESLKRMQAFRERKAAFVVAVQGARSRAKR